MLIRLQRGFSLIELIIVITIIGVLSTITTAIIDIPIRAYIDSSQRATLTSTSESAIKRIQRDIRRALPNSIRISEDGNTIELLPIVDGGRYRAHLDLSTEETTGDQLLINEMDDKFDILGLLKTKNDITLNEDRLVIYPLNSPGHNPYHGDNTTPVSAILTTDTGEQIAFEPFIFPAASPTQRFFIISSPITYHCDLDNSHLLRFSNYATTENITVPRSEYGEIQADLITACRFSYQVGTSTKLALVLIELTLRNQQGESVTLMHQVHLANQP